MGTPKKVRAPSRRFALHVKFVELPKEENDERTKRLAQRIFHVVESANKRNPEPEQSGQDINAILRPDFEKSLGI